MDQAESLRQLVRSKRGDKQETPDEENREEFTVYEHRAATKVITVASGKGGVGKSNFTVNLAIELSKMGNRVMILDIMTLRKTARNILMNMDGYNYENSR